MKKVYDFYQDAGHGWLKVDIAELIRLKIHLAISTCSYMRGGFVYLEEDCDLTKFSQAKVKTDGVLIKFRHHHTDKSSRIRNYCRYEIYTIIPKPTRFEEVRKSALLWWRSVDAYTQQEACCATPEYKKVRLNHNTTISTSAIHRIFKHKFNVN